VPGEAEVISLVKEYYRIDDLVATDRSVSVNRYTKVAAGSWSKRIRAYTKAARLRGERVIGRTKVSEPKVTKLTPEGEPTVARATVCLDVSDVKVVNKQGKSLVPRDRPDFVVERLEVRLKGGDWFVYDIRNKGVKKC
jgi:hypothetical protein